MSRHLRMFPKRTRVRILYLFFSGVRAYNRIRSFGTGTLAYMRTVDILPEAKYQILDIKMRGQAGQAATTQYNTSNHHRPQNRSHTKNHERPHLRPIRHQRDPRRRHYKLSTKRRNSSQDYLM